VKATPHVHLLSQPTAPVTPKLSSPTNLPIIPNASNNQPAPNDHATGDESGSVQNTRKNLDDVNDDDILEYIDAPPSPLPPKHALSPIQAEPVLDKLGICIDP
jgi:hypothetical protein